MLNYIYKTWERIKNKIFQLSPLQLSFIFNLLCLIPFILSHTMKFETSDDFIMELIVSGAYNNQPSPEIMFMHIFVGYILSFLYEIYAHINWYSLFQIAVIFFSLSAISYIFLSQKKTLLTITLDILFLSFVSADLYLLMQFTKTAGIAIIAGGLLLIIYIFEKSNKKYFFLGMVFLEVGLLIRQYTLYITLPFFFLIILFYIYRYRMKIKKNLLKIFICCISVLGCFIGNTITEKMYVNSHSDYSEYKEYNQLRAQLVDYPHPDYYAIKEECQKIGITEIDYLTFLHWNFGDTSYFSKEKLKDLNQILEKYHSEHRTGYKDTLIKLLDRNYMNYIFVWAIIIIGILFLLYQRKMLFIYLIYILGFVSLFYVLLYRGRLVYRIESVILFTVITHLIYLMIYFAKKQNKDYKSFLLTLLSMMLLLRIPLYYQNDSSSVFDIMYYANDNSLSKYRTTFNKENNQQNLFNEIIGHRDNIYLLGFQTTVQSIYLNYNILDIVEPNIFTNSLFLSGADTKHPTVVKILENQNVEDTFALLNHENVYLIENYYIDEIISFINQRSDTKKKKVFIKEIDGYQIWKIVSAKGE